MQFPRAITSPSGKPRWQIADGRSYESVEAAQAAQDCLSIEGATKKSEPDTKAASLFSGIFMLGMGGLLAVAGPYLYLEGALRAKPGAEWLEWLYPIGWLMGFGMALDGAHEVFARLTGRERRFDPEAGTKWVWTKFVPGTIVAVMVAVMAAVVWVAASELFDGVSKGMTIISILLVMIFFALVRRR